MNHFKNIGICYKIIIIMYSSLLVLSSVRQPEAGEVTILNIASYHKGYEWTDECVRGIESKLKDNCRLVTIYMDTKHLPKDRYPCAAEKAWNTYLKMKPDLVMLGDDNALACLGPKFADTETPVVFYGINGNPRNYFKDNTIPPNIRGVLERAQYFPIVWIIHKLVKNIENILILLDDSSTSQAIIDTTLNGKENIDVLDVKMHARVISTYSEWQKVVSEAANHYEVIFLSTFFTIKDERGDTVDHLEVLKWSSANTGIPIFGSSELMVRDDGAIGAFVIVGEKHGEAAAEIAQNILAGRKTSPVSMDKECRLIFNKKQLNRFHFELPEDIAKIAVFK